MPCVFSPSSIPIVWLPLVCPPPHPFSSVQNASSEEGMQFLCHYYKDKGDYNSATRMANRLLDGTGTVRIVMVSPFPLYCSGGVTAFCYGGVTAFPLYCCGGVATVLFSFSSWKRNDCPPTQKHPERQGRANMIPTRTSDAGVSRNNVHRSRARPILPGRIVFS